MLPKLLLLVSVMVSVSLGANTTEVITQAIIDTFLTAHNNYRKNVGVPSLVWNTTISNYAIQYGSQCFWGHSNGPYGENLYASSAKLNGTQAANASVTKWASEIIYMTPDWSCIYNLTNTCGHYSQVVWKNTLSVGCSIWHCDNKIVLANYVICEYWPPGNYQGQTPY